MAGTFYRILEVDLSSGQSKVFEYGEETLRKYGVQMVLAPSDYQLGAKIKLDAGWRLVEDDGRAITSTSPITPCATADVANSRINNMHMLVFFISITRPNMV